MKKIILPILLIVFMIPATNAFAINIGENLSNNTYIIQDLAISKNYWKEITPSLSTQCNNVSVIIAEMVNTEVEGIQIPASKVWAETPLNGCQINLSTSMWETLYKPNISIEKTIYSEFNMATYNMILCEIIVHEYGHILGINDTYSNNGIMNPDSHAGIIPACKYEFVKIEEEYLNQRLIEQKEIQILREKYENRMKSHKHKIKRKRRIKYHKVL